MSIASIRSSNGTCPQEVLRFLMDLFKYNSNQLNKVIHLFTVCLLHLEMSLGPHLCKHLYALREPISGREVNCLKQSFYKLLNFR